jgi:hypothetical protein
MSSNEISAVKERQSANESDDSMKRNMENNPGGFGLRTLAYWAGFASKHAETRAVIAEFRTAEKAARAALERADAVLERKP